MSETPDVMHARILRALARDGDIIAVAEDPSPLLEAALRDVVTALLLRLKFKKPGRPVTFDLLAFHDAVGQYWLHDQMTKDDALLKAGAETGAPLGTVKTRAAKLKRLEKHYAKAERVKEADELIAFIYDTREAPRELLKSTRENQKLWAENARLRAESARLTAKVAELSDRLKKAVQEIERHRGY